MLKFWNVIGVLFLTASVAFAQQQPAASAAEEPLLGSEAETPEQTSPPPAAQPGQVYQILVVGDNLAGGLGAGLSRLGETGKPVVVTNRFNEVSGLARPDFYDWPQALVKITEGRNFDTAVVMIGANDRREFRSLAGRFAFNTPEWKQAYAAQIDGLINVLKARKINVYWVGLPPMADPAYDADVQMMNSIAKERTSALGAIYVDIRADFLNPDGSYTDRGLDEAGVERKLRARDGVTFFKAGNTKMATFVLKAITASTVDKAFVDAGSAAPAVPPVPVAGPTLGQDADGQIVVTEAKDIQVAVAELNKDLGLEKNKAIEVGAALVAKKGSMSERMMTTGEPAPTQVGRFDDAGFVQP